MMDHICKVFSQLLETFKSYVARFEAILQTIVNLEQHLVLITFKLNYCQHQDLIGTIL